MYDNSVSSVATSAPLEARPRSLTERLSDEKSNLEARLEEINGVLESLERHPETQSVLDAVARLGHFGY